MPFEIETIRFNSVHLGDDMSQRQRSQRLALVFDRLNKRKRAAKQAAKTARSSEEHGAQQQDEAQPDTGAEDDTKE